MSSTRRCVYRSRGSAPQIAFIRQIADPALETVAMIGGVGSGKTTGGGAGAMRHCLRHGYPGAKFWIGNVDYTLALEATFAAFKAQCDAFEQLTGQPVIVDENKNRHLYTLCNGVEVSLISYTKPKKIQSVTLFGAWMDEFASTTQQVYEAMHERLRDPRALNKMILTTTLREDAQWIRTVLDTGDPSIGLTFAPSSESYPWIKRGYVSRLRAMMSARRAAQQLDCDWHVVGGFGRTFSDFDEHKHIAAYSPRATTTVYIAVDFGYTAPHALLIANNGYDRAEMAIDVVFDEVIGHDVITPRFFDQIRQRLNYWGIHQPAAFYVDPAGKQRDRHTGKTDIDQLRRAFPHIPIRWTKDNALVQKESQWEFIRWRLDPGAVPDPSNLLLDADGRPTSTSTTPRRIHLYFANRLAIDDDRGIRFAMSNFRRAQDRNGHYLAGIYDPECAEQVHAVDALCYYVANRYGRDHQIYQVRKAHRQNPRQFVAI